MIKKKCLVCKREFWGNSNSIKYCLKCKTRICLICGKEFQIKLSLKNKTKYCSQKCYGIFRKSCIPWIKGKHHSEGTKRKISENSWMRGRYGNKNPHWKGKTNAKGYIHIYQAEHPFCNNHKYVPEHRLVAEKILGRYLTKQELIHHIGIKYLMNSIENKSDNRPKNLYLFRSNGKHAQYHHLKNKSKLKSNL